MAAAAPGFRPLVQARLLTGCRWGELTALDVCDFNPDAKTLYIRTSKSGKGRHVILTDEGAGMFETLSAGRRGSEPMFLRGGDRRWKPSEQSRPMLAACSAARIEPSVSFHVLRHTYASLAIMNGAPLMVVARNLGHADMRMVERHYGHLALPYVADAIRAAMPRFGIEGGGYVKRVSQQDKMP